MKILSKEEEQAHYNYLVKGGVGGGLLGVAVGGFGVWAASARYPAFRKLTIPFRAFLVASSGSFSAILSADRWSRSFEASQHPDQDYTQQQQEIASKLEAQKPARERWVDWTQENKYGIVCGSWVASITAAFAIVRRNKYLSGQQKLVQARVYAQGLTMAVVIASLALETRDRTRGDVSVPAPHRERFTGEDQWKDMVDAEERRMKERGQFVRARAA